MLFAICLLSPQLSRLGFIVETGVHGEEQVVPGYQDRIEQEGIDILCAGIANLPEIAGGKFCTGDVNRLATEHLVDQQDGGFGQLGGIFENRAGQRWRLRPAWRYL